MSERPDERDRPDPADRADAGDEGPMSVSDEELPEDLRPTEDNPLAQPAGDDVPEDTLKDSEQDPGSATG